MKILIKQCNGIGDIVFIVSPIIEILKNRYLNSHITLLTVWGTFKKPHLSIRKNWPFFTTRTRFRGNRNQGGHCISLMACNPYVDEIIQWHDRRLSLDKKICVEDGIHYATWNPKYFQKVRQSGGYDKIYEIDNIIGLDRWENPIKRVLKALGEEESDFSHYRVYPSISDQRKVSDVIKNYPHPRILICEGIETRQIRAWTKEKVEILKKLIEDKFRVKPIWFGSREIPKYFGQELSLREQVEFARQCDVAIGIISGPMHLAASAGIQTITLFGNFALERANTAYHLNKYVKDEKKKHITIQANECKEDPCYIKPTHPCRKIVDLRNQNWKSWADPGQQDTKSCVARISVEEVFKTLKRALEERGLI